MELSTTIPIAKLIPARVITLILRPKRVIIRKVPIMLMGIAVVTTNILEIFLRNRNNTITAREAPKNMF
ncbi:hypothetical protein ES703_83653 [subsurface metagenome]